MERDNAGRILLVPPEQWAGFLLRSSPAAAGIGAAEASRLVTLALGAGREAAEEFSAGGSAYGFAEKMGFSVVLDPATHPGLRFAQCQTDRGRTRITVFQENLLRVQERAGENMWAHCSPLELILWHETFHALEQAAGYTRLLDTKVRLGSFGPFVRVGRLRVLSEIGAMSFSCAAGDFPFAPLILDYWLLAAHDMDEAEKFAYRLLTYGEKELTQERT